MTPKEEIAEKNGTIIKFMSCGDEPHEITIDTGKPIDEQLQTWARYYLNCCTYQGLIADFQRHITETAGIAENTTETGVE